MESSPVVPKLLAEADLGVWCALYEVLVPEVKVLLVFVIRCSRRKGDS
jgi:hypothetical protein